MHTVIVVAIGFALLGLCVFGGHVLGSASGTAAGALAFLPLWLIGAAINMYLGVSRAGYSVREEAPIFLVVFAIPAVAALLTWWKFR
jgi:TRAP-type C4-dicarboxylate transport system permease large subunit